MIIRLLSLLILVFVNFITLKAQEVPEYFISYYNSASTGYYFTAPRNTGVPPALVQYSHMILDGQGRVVYYKNHPQGENASSFSINDNGLMSYTANSKFYFMDSTFTVIDSVNCQNGVPTDSHEMQIAPNGNYLLMGIESITMDLSSYFLFGQNNFPGSATATVQSVVIQELDVNKNVVFEWHAIDHFNFTDVDKAWLTNPNVVDWTHSNALEYDYDGNILLSSRHFNEITKINRQDSSIIWRLGGNANQFTFLNDSMQFKRQHDVRRNANGSLTLFDNGDGLNSNPFHFAAAKEYILDENMLTAYLNSSIVDDSLGYSTAMGNFDFDPAGISLVGYGLSSDYDKLFNSFNSAGQKIFEMEFVDQLISYRSFHYDTLPWSLNRPQLTCYDQNGVYYLDAGSGHSQYLWSNGETTQSIAISDTGTYIAYVPKGQGGFIGSFPVNITDLLNPCSFTSVEDVTAFTWTVYPNPVSDILYIDNYNLSKSTDSAIRIFDSTGKIVRNVKVTSGNQTTVDVSTLSRGIYFIGFNNSFKKIVKQ